MRFKQHSMHGAVYWFLVLLKELGIDNERYKCYDELVTFVTRMMKNNI
jgi:hypothetical protein